LKARQLGGNLSKFGATAEAFFVVEIDPGPWICHCCRAKSLMPGIGTTKLRVLPVEFVRHNKTMRNAKILRLNKAGTPIDWISREEAATLVVKDQVVWALGENAFVIRGGINRLGKQSVLSLPSILASDGSVKLNDFVPPLVNGYLFRRDQFLCMYCGGDFTTDNLSRDHILPVSRSGTDSWTNVVTACKRCNHRKANRTPEEAGMQLLAVPFVPNRYEFFYLANKNILADQMEFLKSQFSRYGTWS
jgi:hypothetical protein